LVGLPHLVVGWILDSFAPLCLVVGLPVALDLHCPLLSCSVTGALVVVGYLIALLPGYVGFVDLVAFDLLIVWLGCAGCLIAPLLGARTVAHPLPYPTFTPHTPHLCCLLVDLVTLLPFAPLLG